MLLIHNNHSLALIESRINTFAKAHESKIIENNGPVVSIYPTSSRFNHSITIIMHSGRSVHIRYSILWLYGSKYTTYNSLINLLMLIIPMREKKEQQKTVKYDTSFFVCNIIPNIYSLFAWYFHFSGDHLMMSIATIRKSI